jgi:spore coat polysaccharide biosynthesis protein SpsF
MSLGVVIQARMGSTRLPGKVLRPVAGKVLLGHIIGRLSQLQHKAIIVVATSTLSQDSVISQWCKNENVNCFLGNEKDVLDRYLCCAQHFGFDRIVRLTGDNPFTDIEELDRLIDLHERNELDYAHSFGSMPIGVGAEIFTFDALLRSHADGHSSCHREHVNEYIQEHPEFFRTGVLRTPSTKYAPNLHLTIDTEEDLLVACELASQNPDGWISTERAISICSRFV